MAADHVLVLQETERAAAGRLGHLLVRIGTVRNALRHHHRGGLEFRQQRRQRGELLLQSHDDGTVIARLQRIQPSLQRCAAGIALHPAVERRDTVARQHLGAVVEPLVLAQRHHPALAIVLDDVTGQHLRLRIHRGIAAEQHVVDHEADVPRRHRTGPHRIEAGQRRLRHEQQCLRGAADGGSRQGCRRGAGQECASFHRNNPCNGYLVSAKKNSEPRMNTGCTRIWRYAGIRCANIGRVALILSVFICGSGFLAALHPFATFQNTTDGPFRIPWTLSRHAALCRYPPSGMNGSDSNDSSWYSRSSRVCSAGSVAPSQSL